MSGSLRRAFIALFLSSLAVNASVLENSSLKSLLQVKTENAAAPKPAATEQVIKKEEIILDEGFKETLYQDLIIEEPVITEVEIYEPELEEVHAAAEPSEAEEPLVEKPELEEDLEQLAQSKRHNTYALLLSKSLKTLENDPWEDAIANLDEVIVYFSEQKSVFKKEPILESYYLLSIAEKQFCQAAQNLDKSLNPDYGAVIKTYNNSKSLINKALELAQPKNQLLTDISIIMHKYIDEELDFIEKRLHKN